MPCWSLGLQRETEPGPAPTWRTFGAECPFALALDSPWFSPRLGGAYEHGGRPLQHLTPSHGAPLRGEEIKADLTEKEMALTLEEPLRQLWTTDLTVCVLASPGLAEDKEACYGAYVSPRILKRLLTEWSEGCCQPHGVFGNRNDQVEDVFALPSLRPGARSMGNAIPLQGMAVVAFWWDVFCCTLHRN